MTAEQFTYWLQGFIEIEDPRSIDPVKTQIIKDHLKLVFDKQTPDRSVNIPNDLKPWPNTTPSFPNKYDIICESNSTKLC